MGNMFVMFAHCGYPRVDFLIFYFSVSYFRPLTSDFRPPTSDFRPTALYFTALAQASVSSFVNKLIPDTSHRLQISWRIRVVFYLFAQAYNVHVQGAGIYIGIVAPNFHHQFFAVDHLVLVL